MKRFPPFYENRRAFTLTEVLLALVICAALVALLFPATYTLKAQSKKLGCLSNLRAIGRALHAYAGEHNGRLPFLAVDQRYWYAPLTLAIRLVGSKGSTGYLERNASKGEWWSDRMLCPGDPNAALWEKGLGYPRSYMYRQTDFSTAWEDQPMKLLHKLRKSPTGATQENARRWLVTDRWDAIPGGAVAPYRGRQSVPANTGVSHPDNWTLSSYWHKGGTNVLYEDGGVEWKAFGEVLGR